MLPWTGSSLLCRDHVWLCGTLHGSGHCPVPCTPPWPYNLPRDWGAEPNWRNKLATSPSVTGRDLENPKPLRVWELFFSPQDVLGWEGYHPPSILWDTSSDQVLPLSAQLLTSWEPALLLHHKSSPAVPSQAEGKAEQPAALQQPNMAKAAGAFCILLLLTALCCQSLAQSKCGHLQDWEWE